MPFTKRYWFWQHKKMLADGVGYIAGSSPLRPLAVKWIECSTEPGAMTEYPSGWTPRLREDFDTYAVKFLQR